jgi:flagellar motor switch protein FliM
MIEDSPISILGTGSISVCDFDHPSKSYAIRMETRDNFDESHSWQMKTSLNSRRGPAASINRDTMMQLLTQSGAQTLRAQTTLADNNISNIMPTNGNFPGGNNFDSTKGNKEKNKPIM